MGVHMQACPPYTHTHTYTHVHVHDILRTESYHLNANLFN